MAKYNKGNKVRTIDTWNNGFGTIIPKGSIVIVICDNGNGVLCRYKDIEIFYEYDWLGEVVYNPPMKERILHFFRDIGDKYIHGYEELSSGLDALEKETRNKTIDEFVERFNEICNSTVLDIDIHTNRPLYDNGDCYWHDLIDEISKKMKGEKETSK